MKIGLISCEIQIVSDKVIHCSVNESLSTSERQLPVTVSSRSLHALECVGQKGSLLQTLRAKGSAVCTGRTYQAHSQAALQKAAQTEGWTKHTALAAVPRAARWRDAGVVSAKAALSHGEGLPRSESWGTGSCLLS